jgi:hypothetical protein
LHEVSKVTILHRRRIGHRLRHLQDHELAEAPDPTMVTGKRIDVSHKIGNVKILEDITPGIRADAGTVQHRRPDPVIIICDIYNQFEHFSFAAHKSPCNQRHLS